MGRLLSDTNALSQTSTASYSIVDPALSGISLPGSGNGSGYYEQTTVIDANGHQSASLVDGWGRTAATETFTGTSPSTYTLYQQTIDTYDYAGDLVQVLLPDGTHTLTFSYDLAGRETGMNDPDRGTESYSYDANGNVTKTVDARGASGTIYAGYDGLNRQAWRSTNSDGSNPTVTYSYDSTASGNNGVGRLTSETFTGGPSNGWTGSYSYTYDGRGQMAGATETINGTAYTTSASYDDAGDMTNQTYPDGEVLATNYTAQGWLGGLTTTPSGQRVTPLVDTVQYTGPSGAMGFPTSYGLNNTAGTDTYSVRLNYDALGRVTDARTTATSSGMALFEEAAGYDAAGNVVTASTTLSTGTDNQAFCYDEQNRLTWAGSAGTPNCGASLTPGTLTSAQYSASYAYDNLDRLTSGPQGSYTYGDSSHLHAATAVGSGYTASYDSVGNMVCRAPTSNTTCSGTATGAQLTYDSEGRLSGWQNAASSPTSTDDFLYDGEGNRVLQQTATNGTTTTTTYIGDLEEIATSGSTTTTTISYYFGGQRIAESVNGSTSYLASDILGSTEVALSASGTVIASALFGPYGQARYANGTMPGTYGFTGQHDDTAVMGLDYFNARYYDPSIGQFASADPVGEGSNLFAYVGNSPESYIDTTGYDRGPADLQRIWQRIQNTLDNGWIRNGAQFGDRTAAAALEQEARTGEPVGNVDAHYGKVSAFRNVLNLWRAAYERYKGFLNKQGKEPPDDFISKNDQAEELLARVEPAIQEWESSPYFSGIRGKDTKPVNGKYPVRQPSEPSASSDPYAVVSAARAARYGRIEQTISNWIGRGISTVPPHPEPSGVPGPWCACSPLPVPFPNVNPGPSAPAPEPAPAPEFPWPFVPAFDIGLATRLG